MKRVVLSGILLSLRASAVLPCGIGAGGLGSQVSNLSHLYHDVNVFVGNPAVPVVSRSQRMQSPFNSVVYIEQWDNRAHKKLGDCTGVIAGNSRILVTAAHCLPKILGTGDRQAFKHHMYILAGLWGRSYTQDEEVTRAELCSKPDLHTTRNAAEDLAIFYLPKPIRNVVPMEVPSARDIPEDCPGNLQTLAYMDDLHKINTLFYVRHCQRVRSAEQVVRVSYPNLVGTIADDCSQTAGSSGGPMFCAEHIGGETKYSLYSISAGGMLLGKHSLINVAYSSRLTNIGIAPSRLLPPMRKCMLRTTSCPQRRRMLRRARLPSSDTAAIE